MEYFPIFLKLKQQACLIVGGGEVALRKAELLLQADAKLHIISPKIHPTLIAWGNDGRITVQQRQYQTGDEQNYRLVIAASNELAVNRAVHDNCEATNILVNVVDQKELCRFIVPAIVNRSPLIIALSSSGYAPMLIRLIKAKIEAWLPHNYGKLTEIAGRLRGAVAKRFPDNKQQQIRRRFWEQIFEGKIAEQALAGNFNQAETAMHDMLQQADLTKLAQGVVYLIGAGPGNPDLLTFRALRLMQRADAVLYDNLVTPEILELVRRDAEKIYVGKQSNNHPIPQQEINKLLIKIAKQGKTVVRLKAGDPFIFGRGGEEIEQLIDANINFEIVPGITAASGAACYAGIPLTHRDHAQSVTFVTGHRRAESTELDWTRLTNETETVVVYMGLGQVEHLCQQLIAHGRNPTTPAAIVERATTTKQRVAIATLATLPQQIINQGIKAPSLIIIGSVVTLHEKLAWYN